MKTHKIKVPSLGESTPEATVGAWLKSVGDSVKQDEVLMELETDKVAVEVIAVTNGIITEIFAAEGDEVTVDQELATITESDASEVTSATESEKPATPAVNISQPAADNKVAMPAAEKVAAANNVSLAGIDGSGRDGRVLKEDVVRQMNTPSTAAPASSSPAKTAVSSQPATLRGEESSRRVPMTPLRKTIANHLKAAQNTAAMLTTFNDVDMTEILELRKKYRDSFEKKHGIKLGFMGFFVKAAVAALRSIPAINAQIDGNDIIYHDHVHVGVAVGTPRGLVVPVVRFADELSIAEIEDQIAQYAVRAREGKLTIDEMKGGTFTITNGGIFGSMLSTPILNAPQSGILGMHRIEKRPVVNSSGDIVARDMMYLALSYDHRIVDGREAVTFLVAMKNALEDPARLLLNV